MSVKSLKTGTRTFSMLAGNTPEHHVLLAETTVGAGGAASVTFSNIPADYQHLQIRGVGRSAANRANDNWVITFNSSATGYNYHWLNGDGSGSYSGYSGSGQVALHFDQQPAATANANVFGVIVCDVLDYTSTTKNKTVRALAGFDNNGSGLVVLNSGLWANTSAITSVTVATNSAYSGGKFVQYSTFQLYGVK